MIEKQYSSWPNVVRTRVLNGATIGVAALALAGAQTTPSVYAETKETVAVSQDTNAQNQISATERDFDDIFAAKHVAADNRIEQSNAERPIVASRSVARVAITECMKIDPSRLHDTLPKFYPNIQLACELAKTEPWAKQNFSAQMNALVYDLWDPESGWNPKADNPGSSAHGIPQALPGKKMGPGWQDNAEAQIKWGLNYITSRYGSPLGAVHARNTRGWY